MSCNWQMITLDKIVTHQKGFAFKSKDYIDFGVPVVRVSNFTMDSIDCSDLKYVDQSVAQKNASVQLVENDVVIATVGSWPTNPASVVGKTVYVPKNVDGSLLNQNAVRLRVKSNEESDQLFLYYLLKNKDFSDYIVSTAQGSANQASITLKDIYGYEFAYPEPHHRKVIAGHLSSIDRKITINTQTNQTLEEMAQAIFKSWFVDFDPVKAKMNGEQPEGMDEATASLFPEKLVESELGLIPEGWSVNQLSDICKNHSQSYDLKSVDEVVFVNTGDVLEGDFLHKDYSPVVGLPGQAKKAIKEDDILYSEIRPKNKRFAYVDFDVSDYVVSTKFMVIQANEKVHPRLLYMMLTRQNTIDEFNVIADSRSGTFPQITFKAISNLEFCMAPRKVQDAFVAQVMPMIQLQRSLKTENKRLAELRDTLLPKLLSGEIELGQAQELAEVE